MLRWLFSFGTLLVGVFGFTLPVKHSLLLPLYSHEIPEFPRSKATFPYSAEYVGADAEVAASSVSGTSLPIDSTKKTSVWTEFSALAENTHAINLGQGFPNWDPPDFVVDAAVNAVKSGYNQYTRTAGHPRLVDLLARRYSTHFKTHVNPRNQIAITIGASQALYVAMKTLLSPGDEVILFEPFFDIYIGQVEIAGAVARYVPLHVENRCFTFDVEELRSHINVNTRAIILNSPHNPTGKVFSLKEMEQIASIVRDHPNLMVISDEVYKYMIYDSGYGASISPLSHVHFASLPDMGDRTVTISSAGKTFSVTGWQVGWVVGPEKVISKIQGSLQFMQFCAPTPFQEALATVIEKADEPYMEYSNYYSWLRCQYLKRRDMLEAALNAANIPTLKSQGGFFLIGDVSNIPVPESYMRESTPVLSAMTKDWAFSKWLALEHGLISIPTAPFFRRNGNGNESYGKYVRFCFCKSDKTIHAANKSLQRMKRMLQAESS